MSSNMMSSIAQAYSPHPGGMPQHAGIGQGHSMSHNSSHPGQAGLGIPQQMHMGVSASGQPVSQGQAIMTGIPPGAGGPTAHALQHLSPSQQQAQAQAQMFQQQAMFASNSQLHQMQQQQHQQLLAQQRHRQAMMAQQYSGMPMNIQNGIPGMTQAQFQAMRSQGGPMRAVNLPQHLQTRQQKAEHGLQQQHQHAQAQAQHQQMLIAQQLAIHQQANAQGQGSNNQTQLNQTNPQPNQNLQQAQNALMQQHHQQQQQQSQVAAAVAASQSNQAQQATQAQAQNNQPNSQTGHIQITPQQSQIAGLPQHVTNAILQQQHQLQQQQQHLQLQQHQQAGEQIKGQCLMKLMLFADHLSNFKPNSGSAESYAASFSQRPSVPGPKKSDDLRYWNSFVEHFFSPRGVFRHSVWLMDEKSNKQYEVTYPALPRYFHTHYESGVRGIQMILEKGTEKELPNNSHYIESQKSSFVYWFDGGSQLVASGTIRAHFDAQQKIDILEFNTTSHEEYLPRTQVVEAARPLHVWGKEWHKINSSPDGKLSPEVNKKKQKLMKSPPQPPPDIEIPASKVKSNMGITHSVFRFLELAEVMIQMNPLFAYSHQNPKISPSNALDQYVSNIAANIGANTGQQLNVAGSRTPALANFTMGVSPAHVHMQLSGGSPHISSPAQVSGTHFQNGHLGTCSSGPSANTSPNSNNKRRRLSAIKAEDENQMNGMHQGSHIKPSPRMGAKRQKGS